jgi:hypothetical protein
VSHCQLSSPAFSDPEHTVHFLLPPTPPRWPPPLPHLCFPASFYGRSEALYNLNIYTMRPTSAFPLMGVETEAQGWVLCTVGVCVRGGVGSLRVFAHRSIYIEVALVTKADLQPFVAGYPVARGVWERPCW